MSHLTIAEISTKTGISKQRLYRFLNQNSINPSIKKSNKSFYNEAVQILIYQRFKQDIKNLNIDIDNTIDTNPDTNYKEKSLNINPKEDFIAIQTPIQTILENELNFKNKEIEKLQNLLQENQKLLDQQQQLTLQANKQIEKLQEQILLLAPEDKENPEETIGDDNQMIAKSSNMEVPEKKETEDTDTAFIFNNKKWWQFWK